MWQDTATIKLYIEDPFYLCRYDLYTRLNELDSHTSIKYNTRLCNVSFSYNFGRQVERSHKAKSSIDDEAGRL